MPKILIDPQFNGADLGEGGIRRVVEAQNRWLPTLGYEIVRDEASADIIAVHGGNVVDSDKATVNHCHGLYWANYDWGKFAADINTRVVRSIRRADLVTAPSKWVASILHRTMWIDPLVAYSGVDLDSWTMMPHRAYVLWNKTRIDPICDPTVVNKLAAMAPDVDFISTFGELADNIQLTGRLPYGDAKKFIQEAGIYLCTARETFGIGTLEAMACGVPVLAWDFAGQREIITHLSDGYLARDYDDLLLGLRYCIEHRAQMSVAARQKVVDKFQWKDRIKDYAQAYQRVVPEDKRVSVVIPSYNLGRFLEQAVVSCLEADEVVIVDDASTDDSLEIAQALESKYDKVKVVKNGVNQYLAKSLNIGIEAASHDYILPVDADNWLEPGAIEILRYGLANRDIDISYGNLRFFKEDGIIPDDSVGIGGYSKWPPDIFSYDKQMMFPFSGIPSSSMFRRKAWKASEGYRARYRTGEDADFWCRLTTLGFQPFKVTEAVVLNYRNRRDSMSRVTEREDWTKWYPPIKNVAVGKPVNIFMGEPLVSVVIYGKGTRINTIDSIWSQTMRLWEIVDKVEEASGRFVYLIKAGDMLVSSGLELLLSVIGEGFVSSECKDPREPFIDCSGLLYPRNFEEAFIGSDLDFMYRMCSKLCGTVVPEATLIRGMEDLQINKQIEWEGELMACGACGQKQAFMIQNPGLEQPDGDMVLLAYNNVQEGVRTYRGRVTGQNYRFSTDEGHNTKYVHIKDADSLMATGLFVRADAPVAV